MEIEDAANAVEQENEQQQQQQQEKQDPREVARMIADELLSRAKPAQTSAERRESKLQKTIEDLIGKGVQKEALETLVKVLKAQDEDREAEMQDRAAAHAAEQFNNALYAQAEEAINDFADKLPNFRTLQPGLVKRMSEVMSQDPEFEQAREIMNKGRVPGMRHFERAADKVIDEVAGGIVKKKQPIELKATTKAKGGDDDSDPTSGLDSDERKLYFAVKNFLGEKKAREAVQRHRAAK